MAQVSEHDSTQSGWQLVLFGLGRPLHSLAVGLFWAASHPGLLYFDGAWDFRLVRSSNDL